MAQVHLLQLVIACILCKRYQPDENKLTNSNTASTGVDQCRLSGVDKLAEYLYIESGLSARGSHDTQERVKSAK